MWVEIPRPLRLPCRLPSSSSWGCELKYLLNLLFDRNISHPPREDVSWNTFSEIELMTCCRHPPREDVSWNVIRLISSFGRYRHPPREDVSWNEADAVKARCYCGHPPREDVSWNAKQNYTMLDNLKSSSSWGCELKWSPVIPRDTSDKSSSSWRCELKYDCKRCHKSSYKLSCLWCLEYIGYSNKNCKVVYEVAI